MQSLFDQLESENLVARLNKLHPDTRPLWGKMTVSQMMAHLQKPLEVALGEHHLKRSFLGFLFGKMSKNKMLKQHQFSKNLPTDASFLIKEEKDFEKEKAKTIDLVNKMSSDGPEALTKNPHPFFGKLTVAEWDLLQWKHLDHHLRQFGV